MADDVLSIDRNAVLVDEMAMQSQRCLILGVSEGDPAKPLMLNGNHELVWAGLGAPAVSDPRHRQIRLVGIVASGEVKAVRPCCIRFRYELDYRAVFADQKGRGFLRTVVGKLRLNAGTAALCNMVDDGDDGVAVAALGAAWVAIARGRPD